MTMVMSTITSTTITTTRKGTKELGKGKNHKKHKRHKKRDFLVPLVLLVVPSPYVQNSLLIQNLLDIGTSEVHHAKFGADLC
jgi:hypothetical protein